MPWGDASRAVETSGCPAGRDATHYRSPRPTTGSLGAGLDEQANGRCVLESAACRHLSALRGATGRPAAASNDAASSAAAAMVGWAARARRHPHHLPPLIATLPLVA
jgi:hypothetical protein